MSSTEDAPALTGTQILALVVLMAEARPLINNELQELAGFTLTGKDKEKLNKLGLVETTKVGRSLCHELTDKGWAAVQRVRTPPRGAGSAIKSMVTLLNNLDRALSGRSSHAMFFNRTAADVAISVPEPVADRGDALETQVRLVYDKLAPAPGEWVSLADLRDALSGMDRPLLDATLRVMARQEDVRIIPTANTKVLDERELSAALQIGDELNHVLSIGAAV
jgi:hypothetical protein